tara:strand:+ start:216 stop:587 length:372 start_codon:yes stop_codon:yes gene_type:complete
MMATLITGQVSHQRWEAEAVEVLQLQLPKQVEMAYRMILQEQVITGQVAVAVVDITLLLVAAAQVVAAAVQGLLLLMALQVVEDIMQVVEALILWEERQEPTLVAVEAVVDGITQGELVVRES